MINPNTVLSLLTELAFKSLSYTDREKKYLQIVDQMEINHDLIGLRYLAEISQAFCKNRGFQLYQLTKNQVITPLQLSDDNTAHLFELTLSGSNCDYQTFQIHNPKLLGFNVNENAKVYMEISTKELELHKDRLSIIALDPNYDYQIKTLSFYDGKRDKLSSDLIFVLANKNFVEKLDVVVGQLYEDYGILLLDSYEDVDDTTVQINANHLRYDDTIVVRMSKEMYLKNSIDITYNDGSIISGLLLDVS